MEVVAAPVSTRPRKETPASATLTTSVAPTIFFSAAAKFGTVAVKAASRKTAGNFRESRQKNVMQLLRALGAIPKHDNAGGQTGAIPGPASTDDPERQQRFPSRPAFGSHPAD
jgi:hypothetical protein